MAEYNARAVAAISTALAPGGIGVVRISGNNSLQVADRVFRAKSGKLLVTQPGYTALYGRVFDGGGAIDEAIALVFHAPASYTGEDVAELSCHGGPVVLQRLLTAVLAAGAAPAGPGEFTRRAFQNGKLGLTEAESVMALISAQGEQAARAAFYERDGALARRIDAVRERLVTAAAHLDAWADYPEDEIPEVTPEELEQALSFAKSELFALLNQFDAGRALREGVSAVIAGRPNVGKSTLMNLLSGCEKSIVTEYAGTTRDIVEDTVLLAGVPVRLADTAGLRFTDDPVESIGVQRARERLQTSQLVFAVFDSSQRLNEEDKELISALQGVPAIAVVNKSDLAIEIDIEYIKSSFKQLVVISALQNEGLSQLEQAVAHVLHTENLDPAAGMLFTERQRTAARRARDCVEEAFSALHGGFTLDAVTVSIEGAISALLELTGERATEAVVDRVFESFCVGK